MDDKTIKELEKNREDLMSGKLDFIRYKKIMDDKEPQDMVVFHRRMINFSFEDFIKTLKDERQLLLETGSDVSTHSLVIERITELSKAYNEGKEIFVIHYMFFELLFPEIKAR